MTAILGVFSILGSLALLIYGMKVMSEGLQKAAGEHLRKLVLSFTKGRIVGLISGLLITTLLQSSTVVSVVLVGMVGVGIVPVINSFAVIMGANIGTTVTAWLTVIFNYQFAIENIIMPLFTIAVVLIFTGKDTRRFWGEFLMGFALLVLGLKMIGQSTPDFDDLPYLFDFAQNYSDINLFNTILYIITGFIATIILQSSSAAIVLTIILSSKGWMGLELGTAMILGSNIGTTLTALIASIAGSIRGKLTALLHFLFNIVGVFIAVIFFQQFLDLNHFILDNVFSFEEEMNMELNLSFALAISHTTFNLLATLLFLPFTQQIYDLFMVLAIKEKKKSIKLRKNTYAPKIKIYEFNLLELQQSLLFFAESISKFCSYLHHSLYAVEESQKKFYYNKISSLSDYHIKFNADLIVQLGNLNKEELSNSSIEKIRQISQSKDLLFSIHELFIKGHELLVFKSEQKIWFTESQRQNIVSSLQLIENNFSDMNLVLKKPDIANRDFLLKKIMDRKDSMIYFTVNGEIENQAGNSIKNKGILLYQSMMNDLKDIAKFQYKLAQNI